MNTKPDTNDACPSGNCCCGGGEVNRRDFLRVTGAGALALLAARLPAMAGPFDAADFERLVPADKKLDAQWVKSLFARGVPSVYRGGDLKYIGMPVGGVCTGQLYLGGDGRLWHWDIFNETAGTGAGHYAHPPEQASPLRQGFAVKIGAGENARSIALDGTGFSEVTFCGQYPVGTVKYSDPAAPVEVTLDAFSPFNPLDTDESSLPATVMRFTVRNTSGAPVEAVLAGSLENAVCARHRDTAAGTRRNRIVAGDGFTFLECSAEKAAGTEPEPAPDIVFEDWSREGYDGWTVQGTAFGSGPVRKSGMPAYQGDVGGDTARVVNSHASAPGKNAGEKDNATGKLTSRPFTIERKRIAFWIGGGHNPGQTCLNLVVDGKIVDSATGKDKNQMEMTAFDVAGLRGRQAAIEIVDAKTGPWGNVGVGRIVFTDRDAEMRAFDQLPDYGTMGLALLGDKAEADSGDQSVPLREQLIGELGRKLNLAPGQSATATFVVTWFFPNLHSIPAVPVQGRYYASRFGSALEVAKHVALNAAPLIERTFLWRDTWYDSTLPHWFLDRTFLNTSILATSTCYRFTDGRFWGWEGVGCCAGTCGHVWYYAQAMGRLFPELERILRERVDFGLALKPDGEIRFRGENNSIPAIDGESGSILRALREHQMSADGAFLKRIWPGVKKATGWLIAQDGNGDGIIEGPQHNTLDSNWYGAVAWLSGIYQAALLAAAEMADEMDDAGFAATCRGIAAKGRANLVSELFNGEYFQNKVDPAHLDAINSGTGCEIDQVMGQSWAFQAGLPRVLPGKETRKALESLWRYNFTPDVGPYRAVYKPGRWYAMAGEAGLLMCTFPRTDWDYDKARGKGNAGFAGYFNECMNGFEHQVAGHMIWEGMLLEGLAIERAIHDRYHPARRNPWNEIECGDHYARSMASYGVFIAACGYEYHGPKGHLGFAPRLTPEDFKAAFTAAEGWGSFSQKRTGTGLDAALSMKQGVLRLNTLRLALAEGMTAKTVAVKAGETAIEATLSQETDRVLVTFAKPLAIKAGQTCEIRIG